MADMCARLAIPSVQNVVSAVCARRFYDYLMYYILLFGQKRSKFAERMSAKAFLTIICQIVGVKPNCWWKRR